MGKFLSLALSWHLGNLMSAKLGLPKSPRVSEAKRKRDRVSLEADKKANQAKTCSVSGCDKNRYGLYPYCRTHAKRYQRYGHPINALPTQGELRAIEGAIKDWLDNDYLTNKHERQAFKLNWAAGQQTIHNHPSFALPFYRLQGISGYTPKAKGWIILSHYFHRQDNSLSDAMLRYLAVRLWSEFKWITPQGSRKGFAKERNYFVNTWAGKFVLSKSGFSKTTRETKVIAWDRPWYISEYPRQSLPKPITETVTKTKTLDRVTAGSISRAIGDELGKAVEHALGTSWVSDYRLLQKASEALGLPHSNPSIQEHFKKY